MDAVIARLCTVRSTCCLHFPGPCFARTCFVGRCHPSHAPGVSPKPPSDPKRSPGSLTTGGRTWERLDAGLRLCRQTLLLLSARVSPCQLRPTISAYEKTIPDPALMTEMPAQPAIRRKWQTDRRHVSALLCGWKLFMCIVFLQLRDAIVFRNSTNRLQYGWSTH